MSDIIKSIKSGYTSRANPRRGYHDSCVTVIFESGSEEEQLAVMQKMQAEKAEVNMWAYDPKKIGDNRWSINYGYDSGD